MKKLFVIAAVVALMIMFTTLTAMARAPTTLVSAMSTSDQIISGLVFTTMAPAISDIDVLTAPTAMAELTVLIQVETDRAISTNYFGRRPCLSGALVNENTRADIITLIDVANTHPFCTAHVALLVNEYNFGQRHEQIVATARTGIKSAAARMDNNTVTGEVGIILRL